MPCVLIYIKLALLNKISTKIKPKYLYNTIKSNP